MNILIVDDEPLIHISIERLIQDSSGEEQIFHAYNGREMLANMEEQEIHLVFVDIKMPGISGLEAIKKARERWPYVRYYIMTGFDEFEYAKQAVKLKVDDFLMKPLDGKTIREILTAVRLQCYLKEEHRKNMFRNWLESTLNGRKGYLGECSGYYATMMVVNIDRPKTEGDPDGFLADLFREYSSRMVSVFTEEGLVLLAFGEKAQSLLEIQRRMAAFGYPEGITCTGTSVTKDYEALKMELGELFEYSCLRAVLGTGRFYYLRPLKDAGEERLDLCRRCVGCQKEYQKKNYTAFLNESQQLIRLLCTSQELKSARVSLRDFIFLSTGIRIREDADEEDLKYAFEQGAGRLVEAPKADERIEPIIQFIKEHYREDLSASDLSRRFGLSAGYISSLLKQTLGLRYSDYVTSLRLNRAKELLAGTGMPVKEIMADCGYYSQSYFTRLFLEREGCTPMEYRKMRREKPHS